MELLDEFNIELYNINECCICNEEINDNEMNCCNCNVNFHKDCLRQWYKKQLQMNHKITCPTCRHEHFECASRTKCCHIDHCDHNKLVKKRKTRQHLDVKQTGKECFVVTGLMFLFVWIVGGLRL